MKAVKYLCTFLSIAFVTLNTHAQITISMKNENGVYTVPCKVNGLKLKFIFDTGASSVSISLTEASFMLKNDYLSLDDIIGTSNYLDANGDINLGVDVILRELEIGGLKLTDVKAKVVNNIKAPLLLGQTAISKLGVIQLNLDSNQLIILNNDKPASPQNLDKVDTIMASDSSALNDFVKLAWNSIDNEDYDEAIFLCNKAINENVKNNIAYIARGVAFDSKKEFELAIEDYTTAIKLNLKDGETYCYRGEDL